MSAGRICHRVVATAVPTESIRVAAERMLENEVGTLVVVDPSQPNELQGIVTDRDIAIRCVAQRFDPDGTPVAKVMSVPVQSVDESTSIEDTLGKMASANVRRLIVTAEGKMVGIVSLDDILDLITEEAGAISRLLNRQMSAVPA